MTQQALINLRQLPFANGQAAQKALVDAARSVGGSGVIGSPNTPKLDLKIQKPRPVIGSKRSAT